jgi:diguanylate cyclase (GGDEF)-like protein
MDRQRQLIGCAILALLYFATGKFGLTMAIVHPSATAVWPAAGIALAALLIYGVELWPGIFIAAFLVNYTTQGSLFVCLGIAAGNTLEAVAATYLVNRFAGGRSGAYHARSVLKFAILAGMLSTAIAATIGTSSLALGGFAHWTEFFAIWKTWWLGDGVGIVLVTPALILWISDPDLKWRRIQYFEAAALLAGLVLISEVTFNGLLIPTRVGYPLTYLSIPFLSWAAFRFGQREAAVAEMVLAGVATAGTLHGFGPFATPSRNESLLLLQSFMGVMGVMTQACAALFAEHKAAEERASLLAVSDGLTGLGNYRKLIDTLEMEIKRSERTGRTFAVLLLDLDGLKKVNDRYGHLVGSTALCRLADVLRSHSRSVDVAARYGGDEFALVMPESDAAAAGHVSRRIAECMANDGGDPAITVSIGSAVFPTEGATVEELLSSADRALYEKKRALGKSLQPAVRHRTSAA